MDIDVGFFHLLQLRSALGLEIKGLKHSKGSAYAYIKKEFGYKGNKQKVYDQLNNKINEIKEQKNENCT